MAGEERSCVNTVSHVFLLFRSLQMSLITVTLTMFSRVSGVTSW